jgi:GNAT superfamily N-acetyltransferase
MSNETPAGYLRSTVTYLEMTTPASTQVPVPPTNVYLTGVLTPSVPFYRSLYDGIGEPWLWIDRRRMSDPELASIIRDPLVEVHVLYADGAPAGYVELDRRSPPDIEIAYLGVMPGQIGKGLGTFLLTSALALAWGRDPRRVWVHTCDHDHPDAPRFYQKGGLVPYREEVDMVADPRLTGELPRDAAPHIPLATIP